MYYKMKTGFLGLRSSFSRVFVFVTPLPRDVYENISGARQRKELFVKYTEKKKTAKFMLTEYV